MITQEAKREILQEHQRSTMDTGSPEAQIAVATARIQEISDHLQRNKKDKSSLRGLKKLTSRRKKLMIYLKRQNAERYRALVSKLGIRG